MNSRKKRFTISRKGASEEGTAENGDDLVGGGATGNECGATGNEGGANGDEGGSTENVGVSESVGSNDNLQATAPTESEEAGDEGPSYYNISMLAAANVGAGGGDNVSSDGSYADAIEVQHLRLADASDEEEDEVSYYNVLKPSKMAIAGDKPQSLVKPLLPEKLSKRVSVPDLKAKEQKDPRMSKKFSLPELNTNQESVEDPDYITAWEATSGAAAAAAKQVASPPDGLLPPCDNRSSLAYASEEGDPHHYIDVIVPDTASDNPSSVANASQESDYDEIVVPATPARPRPRASPTFQSKQDVYKSTMVPPPPSAKPNTSAESKCTVVMPPAAAKPGTAAKVKFWAKKGDKKAAKKGNKLERMGTWEDPHYRGFDMTWWMLSPLKLEQNGRHIAEDIDSLVQDCSNSSALAMVLTV